jgi:hypothetical protein
MVLELARVINPSTCDLGLCWIDMVMIVSKFQVSIPGAADGLSASLVLHQQFVSAYFEVYQGKRDPIRLLILNDHLHLFE